MLGDLFKLLPKVKDVSINENNELQRRVGL